jgi:hypothetical protein
MPPIFQSRSPILDMSTFHLQLADQRPFALIHQLVDASIAQQEYTRSDRGADDLGESRVRGRCHGDASVNNVYCGS